MSLAVIIPSLNEEKYLPLILADLSVQTAKPDEVTVVDGKSQDKTAEIASTFNGFRLLRGERNTAMQRNLGAVNSKAEVLVFLDADVRINPDFLQRLQKKFREGNYDIACPYYVPISRNPLIQYIHFWGNFLFFAVQKILPSGGGGCIIVKRTVFEAMHGFDPAMKFEDIEFIRRTGKKYRFGMIWMTIRVSARRFTQQGILRTWINYLKAFSLFMTGRFAQANEISYEFGKHKP